MALEYSNMLMETFIKVIGHMGLKMEKGWWNLWMVPFMMENGKKVNFMAKE
jgi:hypothetical protein